MVFMKKIIIKIGGNMVEDMRNAWHNPDVLRNGTHTIYVKNAEQARNLLSPERINLLKQSIEYSPRACVSDLVEKSGRKQSAISRDISGLEAMGAIKKHKKGRTVFIEPKINSIEIKFG
ncbi:MAG: hypothetical protein WC821_03590 [archaeon]|jgi:predicted transcriptional regulator